MSCRIVWRLAFLGLMLAATALGCKKAAPPAQASAPPVVPASKPVERSVTDYVEYTGRIDAVQAVGIKARATGFLEPIPKEVKEGAEVKKGEVLFQIDPRPYKAQLDQAVSQVSVVEAQLKLAEVTLARANESFNKGVGSKQDVDQAVAGVEEAKARIKAAQAAVQTYRLNLEFTTVKSPIDGQLSRFFFTPGNLIVQDQTLLTTVVSVDPMYAYFDMDERTMLRIGAEVNAGKIKPPVEQARVLMALERETGFPHEGKLDFVNNVVNPSTGTVSVRAVFDNPKPINGFRLLWPGTFIGIPIPLPTYGTRLLSPGMFVRIRLPIGGEHPALLIVDRAVGSDQGLKYVYVVDSQNKIQYRRVILGPLQDDGLRVIEPCKPAQGNEIETGVKPDERVVVGSLPQLRPRMEINPELVPMPIPGGPPPGTSNGSSALEPPPPGTPKKK